MMVIRQISGKRYKAIGQSGYWCEAEQTSHYQLATRLIVFVSACVCVYACIYVYVRVYD